jgi:hypothetical protein
MNEVDVFEAEGRFDDIHDSLSGRKSRFGSIGGQSVKVVDLAIQSFAENHIITRSVWLLRISLENRADSLVRLPDPVQIPTWH